MQSPLIVASLALATGVAIGIFIQHSSDRQDTKIPTPFQNSDDVATDRMIEKNSETVQFAADINELKRLLQNEIRVRQELEQKVDALNRQLVDIGGDLQSSTAVVSNEQVSDEDDLDVLISNQGWFNEQAMIDSGMNSSQASELKLVFEQLEMERLYLRNQSIRESWSSEKLTEAMQALESREDELKNQLGEAAYDAYLYASGQPNRVAVTNVLEHAQAGKAGIISGDYIVRYDNQRIHNWLDLRDATASGNISDTVALEVERDGETIQFYLARGPLGIRMNSVSIAP